MLHIIVIRALLTWYKWRQGGQGGQGGSTTKPIGGEKSPTRIRPRADAVRTRNRYLRGNITAIAYAGRVVEMFAHVEDILAVATPGSLPCSYCFCSVWGRLRCPCRCRGRCGSAKVIKAVEGSFRGRQSGSASGRMPRLLFFHWRFWVSGYYGDVCFWCGRGGR